MDGAEIRQLRRRAGLTQHRLAEAVGVEQGTVSRWERDIEQPRPGSVRRLRSLLLKDGERLAAARQVAMIRNDLVYGALYDDRSRLHMVSDRGRRYYRDQRGIQIEADYGKTCERALCEMGGDFAWSILRDSGLFSGEALLVRLFISSGGQSHLAHFEPIIENGRPMGVASQMVRQIDAGPPEAAHKLRYADMLSSQPPHRLEKLYCGPGAEVVKSLLS